MEDSFQARVDKVFGSLPYSSSSTSSLSALWSLTDQEIEKREWNRNKEPDQRSLDDDDDDSGFFTQRSQAQIRTTKFPDFGDIEVDECNDISNKSENKKRKKQNPNSIDDEDFDFDIRSSIGLDCTLDYEEEEDEYDKVAVGREKAGDHLYMREILNNYGMDDNSHNEIPCSFKNVTRDPRANHVAAKLRLKEDAETAGNFDSLKLSDIATSPAREAKVNQLDNGVTPKPILKKREISQDAKSPKRVRFQEEFVGAKDAEAFSLSRNSTLMNYSPGLGKASTSYSVPDYVRNPSSYTRYTLDSSDMDEESNRKACMDFLNLLKKPNVTEQCESSVSSPKSLVFTPKKKANDTSVVSEDNEFKQNLSDISKDKAISVGIAAMIAEDCANEICTMEEDKLGIVVDKSSSSQRPGRQYRTRNSVDFDEHFIT